MWLLLTAAADMKRGPCSVYAAGYVESGASGRACCYSPASVKDEGDCSRDCGYQGCAWADGDYCSTSAQQMPVPRTEAERTLVTSLTTGSEGVWLSTMVTGRKRVITDGRITQQKEWKDGAHIEWAEGQPGYGDKVVSKDGKEYTATGSVKAQCICRLCDSDWPSPPPSRPPPPPSASPSPPPPCPPPSPPSSPPPPPPTSPPSPPGPPSPQAPPSAVPAVVGGAVGGAGGLVLVAVGIVLYVRSSGRRRRASREVRARAAETQRKADEARPVPVSHPSGEQELAYKVTGVVAA